MPLTSSGAISLNEMHIEAGGTTGTEATINDTDIIGMIAKTAGTAMSFNEWYGASAGYTSAKQAFLIKGGSRSGTYYVYSSLMPRTTSDSVRGMWDIYLNGGKSGLSTFENDHTSTSSFSAVGGNSGSSSNAFNLNQDGYYALWYSDPGSSSSFSIALIDLSSGSATHYRPTGTSQATRLDTSLIAQNGIAQKDHLIYAAGNKVGSVHPNGTYNWIITTPYNYNSMNRYDSTHWQLSSTNGSGASQNILVNKNTGALSSRYVASSGSGYLYCWRTNLGAWAFSAVYNGGQKYFGGAAGARHSSGSVWGGCYFDGNIVGSSNAPYSQGIVYTQITEDGRIVVGQGGGSFGGGFTRLGVTTATATLAKQWGSYWGNNSSSGGRHQSSTQTEGFFQTDATHICTAGLNYVGDYNPVMAEWNLATGPTTGTYSQGFKVDNYSASNIYTPEVANSTSGGSGSGYSGFQTSRLGSSSPTLQGNTSGFSVTTGGNVPTASAPSGYSNISAWSNGIGAPSGPYLITGY
jgi:hypothetical protein